MSRLRLDAVVEQMHKAGCSSEQIGAVVSGLQFKPAKSSAAIRQARYRERKQPESVTVTPNVTHNVTHNVMPNVTPDERNKKRNVTRNVTPNVTPLARVEDSPSDSESHGKNQESVDLCENQRHAVTAKVTPAETPRQALESVITPDMADSVLRHRQALKKPLTLFAAQLLAKGFLATGDPQDAAQTMIERGWQGFRAEWYENDKLGGQNGQQQQQRGRRGGSIVDAGRELLRKFDARAGELRSQGGDRSGDSPLRLLPGFRRE